MNIDLNDEQFNAKEGKAIFNKGNAGVVSNVMISVSKKKPEDKENAPDYKLTFTDETNASTDMGFYTVKGDVTFKTGNVLTKEEQVKKQGTVMKHVIHAIYGDGYTIPPATIDTLLDVCMKTIREGLGSGLKFRVFANYGTPDYPKTFIQVRPWVPFMESMTVAESDTRLISGKTDNLVRLAQDNVGTSPAAAAANLTDDWD